MAAPKILVSVPVNGSPQQIYEQTVAYTSAMNGNCHHVIHVSRDAVQKDAMNTGHLRVGDLPDVSLNDRHYFSKTPSILGVHVMNMEFALRRGLDFDYVYLHTASDLPYRPNLDQHIAAHDFGMAPSRTVDATKTSGWTPAVVDHRPIRELVSFFGVDAPIYTTRTEGFFCRRELFFEIMWYAKVHIPFERENIWRGSYPYEEYVLPTVVEHILGSSGLKRTRHAVLTTTSDSRFSLGTRERLSEQDIPVLESLEPSVFAFKFAPNEMDSPVRQWIRGQLGYKVPEA